MVENRPSSVPPSEDNGLSIPLQNAPYPPASTTVAGLTIHFDNPFRVYFPGENVSGAVIYVDPAKADFKIQGLSLGCKNTPIWQEVAQFASPDIPLPGVEQDFEYLEWLIGEGKETTLTAGLPNIFKFSFTIPKSLKRHLLVNYRIEATLKRSGQPAEIVDPNIVAQEFFELANPVDLNEMCKVKPEWFVRYFSTPVTIESMTTIGCCCSSRSLTLVLSIPKRAFAIGQTIPVHIEIINLSTRRILYISATFVQKSGIYGQRDLVLQSRPGNDMLPGAFVSWDLEFIVPSVAPTRSEMALDSIAYAIQAYVFLESDSGHKGTFMEFTPEPLLELVIGNVEFNKALFGNFIPPSRVPSRPTNPQPVNQQVPPGSSQIPSSKDAV